MVRGPARFLRESSLPVTRKRNLEGRTGVGGGEGSRGGVMEGGGGQYDAVEKTGEDQPPGLTFGGKSA